MQCLNNYICIVFRDFHVWNESWCCRFDLPPGQGTMVGRRLILLHRNARKVYFYILLTSNFSDHINILSFDILQLYHLNTFMPLNMLTGPNLYGRASSWSRHLYVSYALSCLVISIVLPLEYQILSNPCQSVCNEF